MSKAWRGSDYKYVEIYVTKYKGGLLKKKEKEEEFMRINWEKEMERKAGEIIVP